MSDYEETVEEPSSVQGMLNMYKALGLSMSGERIAQHALISAVLAVQVLVVGSLPAAMLTQVRDASRCCCYMGHSQGPLHIPHVVGGFLCLLSGVVYHYPPIWRLLLDWPVMHYVQLPRLSLLSNVL